MSEQGQTTERGRRSEDAHLEELERQLRRFLAFAEDHPLHRFSSGAQTLIVESKPVVEQLDHVRARRKRPRRVVTPSD
jgi:hypothetical protein